MESLVPNRSCIIAAALPLFTAFKNRLVGQSFAGLLGSKFLCPFVPNLCPGGFCSELEIFAGMHLTPWPRMYFSVPAGNASQKMKKPANGGPSH
jgi:hypothetical protein